MINYTKSFSKEVAHRNISKREQKRQVRRDLKVEKAEQKYLKAKELEGRPYGERLKSKVKGVTPTAIALTAGTAVPTYIIGRVLGSPKKIAAKRAAQVGGAALVGTGVGTLVSAIPTGHRKTRKAKAKLEYAKIRAN